VKAVENALDPALLSINKTNWSTLESVGDQSGYVNEFYAKLNQYIPIIKATLTANKHFRTFCDKFVE
jgi:hypothetical protein